MLSTMDANNGPKMAERPLYNPRQGSERRNEELWLPDIGGDQLAKRRAHLQN